RRVRCQGQGVHVPQLGGLDGGQLVGGDGRRIGAVAAAQLVVGGEILGLVGALGAAVLGEGDLEGGAARGLPGGFEAHPENQRPVEQGGQQQGRPQTIAPGPVGECRGGGHGPSSAKAAGDG